MISISDLHPHEQLVLGQIRKHGGFTDWWISEVPHRIAALEKLVNRGVVRATGGQYPFATYEENETQAPLSAGLSHGADHG